MRTSKYLLATMKNIPGDAEVISHKLMLRAGMIRQLASGIYTWLPIGLRILRKVESIVREEMNNTGAIEVSMPIVQPADFWQESGRWNQYGQELLRFTDRSKRKFLLGPTHEEVITDLIRNEVSSYKQLPLNFFQIQTKFRDEVRPRFGVMRSREFVMKDAYSFHTSQESLQATYNQMYSTYNNIFTRMGLNFCAVQANTGSIGGHISHEFHVLVGTGEEQIVFSTTSNYAANIEMVEAVIPSTKRDKPSEKMHLVDTYDVFTIADLVKKYKLPVEKTVKMIFVHAKEDVKQPLVALMLRGDHVINETKVEKLPQVAKPIIFATEDYIRNILNLNVSIFSLGPINFPLPIVIDRSVALMSNFVTGSNIQGKHFFGVNWERDVALPEVADLRQVVNGDLSPDGHGTINIKRGIEVGHIFQLGKKYSRAMRAMVQDKNSCNTIVTMGCYGIGITRLIAATIEQYHDNKGIVWPEVIAPFNVVLLPINLHNSLRIKNTAETIYHKLSTSNIDVLLDDRKERLGVMFADMELIGVPHIIIISDRLLDNEEIEYKNRRSGEIQIIKLSTIVDFITDKITIGMR
ncbi:proline--tRNA ligase [Candidatus Palibaumannia cicadellinicola]|uniref:Proline--tRNA ligase n=1 Tax=Candidatus Palibaumannia cicadellinicola TaxID=186490 RepID=A0A0K2BL68_9GAMM|nr:proline--tRNA ligase [Candidatus Baumannia cicadellinicola]AKZ66131.1 Prolyl-tRNA synthetase [Candidatus Baumannia cicadellinicola]